MLHDVLQPRRHQHQGRVAAREGPYDSRPPPDLAVDALDTVIGPDSAPVLRREVRVGESLGEAVAHRPRGRAEPHPVQLVRHLRRLPRARLARFLRVNRLQQARHGLPPGHGHPSQHVSVEVDRAALVACPGEHLLERTEHPRALVAGDEPHAGEPAPPEPREELAPRVRRLGVALRAADDLPVAGGVDADGHQNGHVLVGPSPAALEVDAVDENVRVIALERPLAPGLDGRERLLVEVGDGAGGHGRSPEEFGDVLDSPGRDAREVHLDDGLLDRSLAPAVALDNGRLEGRAAQLRHVELDLSCPGDELSRVVAAAVCPPACRPLVAPGPYELGRLLVEQRVERLLDGLPHQILYVLAQRLLVDCYDVRRHGPCPFRR